MQIEYRGSAVFASALVQCLEDEGVDVEWEPPSEWRSMATEIAAAAAIGIAVNGTYDAIKAGVKKFRERYGDKAEVEIVGDKSEQ